MKIINSIIIVGLGIFIFSGIAAAKEPYYGPEHYQGKGILVTTPSMKDNVPNSTSCNLITGTWEGYFVDNTGLNYDGGPWKIKLSLFYQAVNDKYAGNVIGYVNNKVLAGKIWAQCNSGKLQKVFVGDKNTCAAFGSGMLISDNVLLLNIPQQNAMIGTTFMVVLKRINNSYPYPVPKQEKDFILGKVKSCR